LNHAEGKKIGMEENNMESLSVEIDMDDEIWSEDDASCKFI
jgi:hypothetical protein